MTARGITQERPFMTLAPVRTSTSAKEQVAIHQAGHAALAIFRGAPLSSVDLTQDIPWFLVRDDQNTGRENTLTGVELFVHLVAELFSGTVAERKAGYKRAVPLDAESIMMEIVLAGAHPYSHWPQEAEQAYKWVRGRHSEVDTEQLLVAGWVKAVELLEEHWTTVQAIASALMGAPSQSLAGDELRALFATSSR
jgi:hypothetical protein